MKTQVSLVLAATLSLGACQAAPSSGKPEPPKPAVALETEDQKTLYAIGLVISQNLAPLGLTEADLSAIEAGITDGVLGREKRVDLRVYGPKIRDFAQARAQASAAAQKKSGEEFLLKAAAEEGAVRTASGVVYKELRGGSGPSPTATDKVRVRYTGRLVDGTVFDSSADGDAPAELDLARVIPCWTEGVQKMKVGGKGRLVCPPDTAYGDQGAPPVIPGGATLVFEVELLDIVR
jgi:FKBP-type peptidyl-prolyl cis-trans isomerase